MEVGEEEGGAPPFFPYSTPLDMRGEREGAGSAIQRNSRLFNKLGQTERTAPPLRERREQEQHIPRNAESVTHAQKKKLTRKTKQKKGKNYEKRTTT